MGGNDVFCCFCGALASKPWWESADETAYNPAILSPEDTEWMEEVRILATNTESSSINKAYLTGRAHVWDYGFYDVEPSDDLNFPDPAQAEYDNDGLVRYRAYQHADPPFCVVFHDVCYDHIFQSLLSFRGKGNSVDETIDLDVLYRALKSISHDDFGYCLKLDYGPIAVNHHQYWGCTRGEEVWATNPHDVPALADLYKNLPQINERDSSNATPSAQMWNVSSTSNSNCFSGLPAELVLNIMHYLPATSMNSLRASSRAVYKVVLSNSFWKHRVLNDMPWLYDLPSSTYDAGGTVDWKAAYPYLLRRSEETYDDKILGLVNRRRIWSLCDVLGDVYQQGLDEKKRDQPVASSELGDTLTTSRLITTLWPASTESKSFKTYAIRSCSDVLAYRLQFGMSVLEGSNGVQEITTSLANDSSDIVTHPHNVHGGSTSTAMKLRSAGIILPRGDWVRSFIIYIEDRKTFQNENKHMITGITIIPLFSSAQTMGSEMGYKRILNVSPGHIFVGFQGELNDHFVSSLAIIEGCPPAELPAFSRYINVGPPQNKEIAKHLWESAFPPANATLSVPHFGYWSTAIHADTRAYSALIFGTTAAEFATIVAISVDALLGGIAVHYSDRPPRAIGPQHHAMHVLPIDGAGGERIVGMSVSVSKLPTALRFKTNRGRQLGVGDFGPSADEHVPAPGLAFVGVYATWSFKSFRILALAAAAMISAPLPDDVVNDVEPTTTLTWSNDSSNIFWHESPPPSSWQTFGTLIPPPLLPSPTTQPPFHNKFIPPPAHKKAWLDFTRPINKITLISVHPCVANPWFAGLAVHYADEEGGTRAAGPLNINNDIFGQEGAGEGNATRFCFCEGSRDRLKFTAPWDSRLHYWEDEWLVGGSRVAAMQVWSGKAVILGMQFVREGGGEGPRWGMCEGAATDAVRFVGDGGVAGGLEVLLGLNARCVTLDDEVIRGFQALVEE